MVNLLANYKHLYLNPHELGMFTDNSVADSGSPDTSEASLTPERGGSTAVDVPPKYGGEWAELLRTHNHEEIMERLKHVQLGDRTKYRWVGRMMMIGSEPH